jgi:hypothetical protein
MSDQTSDAERPTTAVNVQRLESGYFDHLESLRSQIHVGDYLVSETTMRWALVSMAVVSVLLFVLFPFTMYNQFTPVVTLVYMIAYAGFAYIFYERIMVPNEAPEEWRD